MLGTRLIILPISLQSGSIFMNARAIAFGDYGGWFDQRFGTAPLVRYPTFKSSIGLFLQHLGDRTDGVIVETGTQRLPNDWGAGCSTTVFGETLETFNAGRLWTVDLSPENLATSQHCTQHVAHRIEYVCSDSIAFLKQFDRPIDFLYLDSLDWWDDPQLQRESQEHQLAEVQAIWAKLRPDCVILLDDNGLPGGGKAKLTKQFLAAQGWTCVLDYHQSLWISETVIF
jgi:predicted O-methyltransferase YrrM